MSKESIYLEVIELVKRIKGDRTLAQFSKDCGVSISNLSRLVNGELKKIPTPEMLKKLTDPKANPQNSITYQDMMIVAGYNSVYEEAEMKNILINSMVKENSTQYAFIEQRRDSYIDRRNKEIQYEVLSKGILCTKLAQRGIRFSLKEEVAIESKGRVYRPDALLEIHEKFLIKSWWLEFKFYKEEHMHSELITRWFLNFLGRLTLFAPNHEQKISLVVNSISIYNQLKQWRGNIAYKGNLSIILVDIEEIKFVEETYISFYGEEQADYLLVD